MITHLLAVLIFATFALPVSAADTPKVNYLLKTCHELSTLVGGPDSAERIVDPAGAVASKGDPGSVRTTILKKPKHGAISLVTDNVDWPLYRYAPHSDYMVGKDQVTFLASYRGNTYKVVVDLLVEYVTDGNAPQCPKPRLIKLTVRNSDSPPHRGPTHH